MPGEGCGNRLKQEVGGGSSRIPASMLGSQDRDISQSELQRHERQVHAWLRRIITSHIMVVWHPSAPTLAPPTSSGVMWYIVPSW